MISLDYLFLRADIMSETLTHASVDAAILKTDGLYFQSTLPRYWDLVGGSMMIEGIIMALIMINDDDNWQPLNV